MVRSGSAPSPKLSMIRIQPVFLRSMGLIACALVLLARPGAVDDVHAAPSEGAVPESADLDENDEHDFGYPVEQRPVGVPGDAEEDLDSSFPQRDSVLSGLRYPRGLGL